MRGGKLEKKCEGYRKLTSPFAKKIEKTYNTQYEVGTGNPLINEVNWGEKINFNPTVIRSLKLHNKIGFFFPGESTHPSQNFAFRSRHFFLTGVKTNQPPEGFHQVRLHNHLDLGGSKKTNRKIWSLMFSNPLNKSPKQPVKKKT